GKLQQRQVELFEALFVSHRRLRRRQKRANRRKVGRLGRWTPSERVRNLHADGSRALGRGRSLRAETERIAEGEGVAVRVEQVADEQPGAEARAGQRRRGVD